VQFKICTFFTALFINKKREYLRNIRFFFLFECLLITFCPPAAAQVMDHLKFRRYGIEKGLSQARAQCILQDNNGYIWIGTQDGLNRFNGYTYTIFKHNRKDSTSLSNNEVWSIFQDRQNRIWVGTVGGGLNLYDSQTETFSHFQHDANNPLSLSNNIVLSIFQDQQNRIWVGTRGGGLNLFDPQTRTFTRFVHDVNNPASLSNNIVRSILQDQQKRIWVGTRGGGISLLNPETLTFSHFQNDPDDPLSLSNNFVRSIFQDQQNRIWVGTAGGGLDFFDLQTESFSHYQHDPNNPTSLSNNSIRSIFQDKQNNIWVGTDGGLNLLNPQTKVFKHFQHDTNNSASLSNNEVWNILQDQQGGIWILTRHGANLLDLETQFFTHYKHDTNNPASLSNSSVKNIFQDQQNRIWIGTDGGGLNLYDPQTQTFTHFQHDPANELSLSNNEVWSIFQDRQNRIWIGTNRGGLNLFDPETETFSHFQHDPADPLSLSNNRIRSIFQDRQNRIWVGTFEGLNLLDTQAETFTRYQHDPDNPLSLSHNRVFAIFEDRQNRIWVGTSEGLNLFDPQTETFNRFLHDANHSFALSNNSVNSILQDQQNRIWIATDGGLNLFDPEAINFKSWNEKDGLSNDLIYGMLEDGKGNLWLSTNKGINKFNPVTEKFVWYDNQDGLQSDEFSSGSFHKARDGRMFFGGINGFNMFHPDSIKDNVYIPPVVITDFLLFNESVAISDTIVLKKTSDYIKEITLEHDEFIFSFEFSALNYRQPEKNQFAYKLEPFNNDWIYTDYKDRKASYTSVPHGTYTFRVKASNDDGYWNEEGTSVTVIILPPWWLTLWAKILWIILFIAIPLAIYKTRVNRLKWQKIKLEKEVKNRISQVNQQKEKLTIQADHLLEANQEISKQKDSYKGNYEILKSLSEIEAKIISTLSSGSASEEIYDALAAILHDNVNSLFPGESLYMCLYNKDNNTLEFTKGIEKGNTIPATTYNLEKDSNRLSVICFKNRKVTLTNDLKKDFPDYPLPIFGEQPMSVLCIPINQQSTMIGVLTVYSFQKNAYNDYHVYILQNLASYVGIALENAKTLEKLENKLKENEILIEVSSNLIAPIELELLLKSIVDAAVALVPNAQTGSIFLLNSDETVLEGKVSHRFLADKIKKVKFEIGEGIRGKAVAEKRSFIENNVYYDQVIQQQLSDENTKSLKSIIVVLLKEKLEIIGTISVDNYDINDAFSKKDMDILSSLAANASVAISRVKMREEIESAKNNLDVAYEKLKSLDDYKEAMTAMIIHDFKNSLNTVISFSEGTPTERRLKSIRQAGQFMLNMVLNILDVQKFDTTEIKLAPSNNPIKKSINEAVNQLSYMIEQKSIKLTYEITEGHICTYDYELTTRVIVNILSNAIKYVPTNGCIKVSSKVKGNYILTSIQDNGSGIPKDKIHLVWGKFSQIDEKKSGRVRSTGIGLTFCKMVVEAQGGKVGVESEEGKGSNFYFTLPIVKQTDIQEVPIEKLSIVKQEAKAIELSDNEKKTLAPYLTELQQWEVYDYSEVKSILSSIKANGNPAIAAWLEEIQKALQNVNEENYLNLINL
jgi:ligand-binding sensor domain-containing protein/signal transduction histidine kinase